MNYQEVELLAIGAGPSNLALGVAVEELAEDAFARSSLIVEQASSVAWQRGLLLPTAQSQVSFLKDLVTMRDPRSRFTFINYLHSVGRLQDFINLGTTLPYRQEVSDYLRWVAASLSRVRVEFGRRCASVEPCSGAVGEIESWLAHFTDGSSVRCRNLVLGGGRDPYIPKAFGEIDRNKVIHSSEYSERIAATPHAEDMRVLVVGSAQSAVEMFDAVQRDLPNCRPTMVVRSVGPRLYETSKFVNELYYPTFVDTFFGLDEASRVRILRAMHTTNYSGVDATTLDALYRSVYVDRMSRSPRLTVRSICDVSGARQVGDEVFVRLTDWATGESEEVPYDLVLLGTGYVGAMPRIAKELATAIGLERIEVSRHYRMLTGQTASAACYVQGVNERTHGIADSLLSVLAVRGAEILSDILERVGCLVDAAAIPATAQWT